MQPLWFSTCEPYDQEYEWEYPHRIGCEIPDGLLLTLAVAPTHKIYCELSWISCKDQWISD